MKLGRLTPAKKIDIWQPRWKDKVILIAKFKVGTHNCITFSKTKTESLQGEWYLSGETIKSYPLETNGTIPCYAVPIDMLEPLERE